MGSRIVVTGGAGFIGANVAVSLARRNPSDHVIAVDNLRRRGSELNLPRLRDCGVEFLHADVREPADFDTLTEVDAIVECSADPSVLAGADDKADYLIGSNLIGAYNCLEFARRNEAFLVFLSTSRVYPLRILENLRLEECDSRYELSNDQEIPGVSTAGISEATPLSGARTLYGATKLAAEVLIEEYRAAYGLRAVIDRCGVIAGPWQMGTIDQGVFTYWVLAHHFRRPLRYIGFGGSGKQVRDVLHVNDLADLIAEQLAYSETWDGLTVNVGGGRGCSLSLLETTVICADLTGNSLEVSGSDETRPGDVPLYLSDCSRLFSLSSWRPKCSARDVLVDTYQWVLDNEAGIFNAL